MDPPRRTRGRTHRGAISRWRRGRRREAVNRGGRRREDVSGLMVDRGHLMIILEAMLYASAIPNRQREEAEHRFCISIQRSFLTSDVAARRYTSEVHLAWTLRNAIVGDKKNAISTSSRNIEASHVTPTHSSQTAALYRRQ
ncbi:hypothetical protein KCP70_13825 [Salmonella enterica subsp. enterica]|nr:hypothetical protein KCP70_13825 [Salmonella enterica subsp. enterica]